MEATRRQKIRKAALRRAAGVSPNTFSKINKGEDVAISVLDRICKKIDCDYGNIITRIPDEEKF